MINMLKSSQIYDTTVDFYVRDILSFVKWFDFAFWSFVKRGGNMIAHDPLCLQGKIWESDIPDNALDWASEDMYTFVDCNLIEPSSPFCIKKKKKERGGKKIKKKIIQMGLGFIR